MYNVGFESYYRRLEMNFAIDPSVTLVDREVYNIFMLLGDVGGFSGLLLSLGAILIGIINFQNAENFVVKSLYLGSAKATSKRKDPYQNGPTKKQHSDIDPSK